MASSTPPLVCLSIRARKINMERASRAMSRGVCWSYPRGKPARANSRLKKMSVFLLRCAPTSRHKIIPTPVTKRNESTR
jgi:hypothetical protein